MTGPAAPDAGKGTRPGHDVERRWERRRRRPYLWTAAAVLGSIAIVAVAWFYDSRSPGPTRTTRRHAAPVTELVIPSPLSEQERSGSGPRFGSQESVRLTEGAWVQVADAKGNLKQQYTAARIDPLPDKRLSMDAPRAVLYGEGGRIVTMRGDAMTARVPRRELESGRLVGNVVIRIYRPRDGKPVDLRGDAPEVVVECPEASFDAESGEVRCDRQVRILGDSVSFDGEGLSMTLSPGGGSIERLVVDRALSPLRINRTAAGMGKGRRAAADAPAWGASALHGGWVPAVALASAPPAKETGRLFELTMDGGVSVTSWEGTRVSTVTGDAVRAVFRMREGGGLGVAGARPGPFGGPSATAVAAGGAGSPRAQLAVAALGAGAWADDEDLVEIEFKGRLVMVPADASTPALGAPDAVRVTVTGTPARIEDSLSETVVVARRATFESVVERMELEGTLEEPASVRNPDFTLDAARFALDRAAGTGSSEGPGTIVMGGAGSKPLLVSWSRRMSLRLAPGTGDAEGSFRGADFEGDVDARGTDFELESGSLTVEARPEGRKDVPRRIAAAGGVRARGLGESRGRFEAQHVEIALSPNAAGDAQPRTLTATGGVMAADDAQTLWASSLRATFVEPKPGAAAPSDGAMRSDVGEVVAEGPVELALSDGSRVYATRLEGDGAGRSARLVGPDVMVIRGNLVLDQLSEVNVQEMPARLGALGPGRASGFRDEVLPRAEGRVGRPKVGGVPRMQATWRESLAYADGAVKSRDGTPDRGLLLLQGGVRVRASREAREAEALDADEVQVELLPRGGAPRASRAAAAPGAGDAQAIGTMRAVGNVRLEARQWADERREGDPRLFRMNAPNVSYDGPSGSASVDGAGTLLVFDPPPPAEPARADAPKSPFSPHGTTRFSWKRSLSLERMADRTSRITLERDVVMDHLGESSAATGTVNADRMIATVRGVEAGNAPRAADGGLSLGGPAELTRVRADGRVAVRTGDVDVEANEFDLDVPTQVGFARGGDGRLATVVRRGTAAPARAHAFRWDLAKGTLTVEGARGTIGR